MQNTTANFNLSNLSKKELIALLHGIVDELKHYSNGELKKGQKIIVGTKYANDIEMKDEYDIVANHIGVINNPDIGPYYIDENGIEMPCIEIRVEGVGRFKIFHIHPEDAIPID